MSSQEILPYHPPALSCIQPIKKRGRPVRIKPSFHQYLGKDFEFHLYVGYIEHVVEKILPADILADYKQAESLASLRKVLHRLNEALPITEYSLPEELPGLLYINSLCGSSYTHGVGRFLSDTFSRWLIPGKSFPIFCSPSLNFCFLDYDRSNFFFHQVVLQIADEKELNIIKNQLPTLSREINTTILAVKHARHVMAIKNLSAEQKAAVIQDNLESLLNRPAKEFDHSIFDHMHQFLVKLSAEEKIGQINEQMVPLMNQRPNVFEADIFQEIQHFVFLFRDRFTALRDPRHITRLIAFQYLFRKSIKNASLSNKERHLALKLLKTKLRSPTRTRHALGVLVGMNIIREQEMFEQKQTFEAIQNCLPNVTQVKDSYVIDRRDQDKVRLFYLEIEKEDNAPFTLAEMKELKKRLPREIKANIENITHSIFMPRNEEEVMRNIVLLSQELKYARDIPQVVISFDSQTETDLIYTIILLRILQSKDTSLEELFVHSKSNVRFQEFDATEVGLLRKKYVKEANVFIAKLDKKPFLRKDYSLDLFKARQNVSKELCVILGDIRDFNGGILAKQQELFCELRESLSEPHQKNDFLLENFFYAISPPIMQSLLSSSVLKMLYLMLAEALEHSFKENLFFLKTQWAPEYVLIMAAALKPSFKETVFSQVNQLKIPSSDLSFTSVKVYEITALGYIYRCEDPKQCALLSNTVQQAMQSWEKNENGSFKK